MKETFGRFKCSLFCGLLFLLIIGNMVSIEGTDHQNGPTNNIIGTKKEKELLLSSNYFIQNMGQIKSDEIQFYSRGGSVFFTPDNVLYRFSEMEPIDEDGLVLDPNRGHMEQNPSEYHEWGVVLKYSFIGSNNVIPEGRDPCAWNTNYFKGNNPEKWYTDVPNYKEIVYPELWDGIDLVYRLKEGSIKYDLIVHPGADPSNIRIQIDGTNGLSINSQGDLVIGTEYRDILDSGLISHYGDGGGEQIPCKFELVNECEYKIKIGEFDKSRIVVIDPVIDYSTFIGGLDRDFGYGIVIDTSGNAYITGNTYDGTTDYPTTSGAYDITYNGGQYDVFVTKLNSDGSSLMYSTFIGGSSSDYGWGIAIDTSGNAYITGSTYEGPTDYPTTSGAFDTTHNGFGDVFVTKLNSTGSSLVYSTFIGGLERDTGFGIVVDTSGNAFITGNTEDGTTDYPNTTGAYDATHNGELDVFVTKLNSAGSSLMYSTFIGGSSNDYGRGIAIDINGNAYVTGYTEDGEIEYPTTSGAFDTTHNGRYDVFVTKLNSAGSSLVYSTFIGGTNSDYGYDIAVDTSGNAYITGSTYGSSNITTNYPTTLGAYDTTINGDDLFVTKLNSSGSSLVYSTFIGGSRDDDGLGIAIDTSGNAYITGSTYEGTTKYPTTTGAYDTTHNGKSDVFVSKLNSTGSSLLYSTFIGGSGNDYGQGIAIDTNGRAYITGITYEGTTKYPTTSGAFDTTHNGDYDLFVTKIDLIRTPGIPLDLSAVFGDSFVELSWSPPEDDGGPPITEYEVHRGNTSGLLSIISFTGGNTTFNDTSVVNGNRYYYAVLAHNRVGPGKLSNEVSVVPVTIPTPPRNVDAQYGNKNVRLTWISPENDGGTVLTGFRMYKFEGGSPDPEVFIIDPFVDNYTDEEVDNGINYRYYMTSFNAIGESPPSIEVNVTPKDRPSLVLDFQISSGQGFILLQWRPPEYDGGSPVINYTIFRAVGSGSLANYVTLPPQHIQYNDTSVENGVVHRYRIIAVNSEGSSDPSEEIFATPIGRPSIPENLEVMAYSHSVKLSWEMPLKDGGTPILGFRIYRSDKNKIWNNIQEMEAYEVSFADNTVSNGMTYYYRITAFNAVGESDPTETVNATPLGKPGLPMGFDIISGDSIVLLKWELPLDLGGIPVMEFKIYKADFSSEMDLYTRVTASEMFYNDTQVTNGEIYYYKVAAVNIIGEGPFTETKVAKPMGLPFPPFNVRAVAGDSFVNISWSVPINDGGDPISEITLFRGTDPNSSVSIFTSSIYERSFKDTTVTNGVTYYYSMIAVNSLGKSPKSLPISITPSGKPSIPMNVQIEAGSETITLSWQAPNDNGGLEITGYKIYRTSTTGSRVLIDPGEPNNLEYIDRDVVRGSKYLYQISAENENGESPLSEPVNGIVKDSPKQGLVIVAVAILIILFILLGIVAFVIISRQKRNLPPSLTTQMKSPDMPVPEDFTQLQPIPIQNVTSTQAQDTLPSERDP